MKSKISAVIAFLLGTLLLSFNCFAENALLDTDSIVNYKLAECEAETVQEWIDTELAENAGVSSEWYVIALSQSGEYDFSAYRNALESYVGNNSVSSAATRLKYALALLAVGSDSDYISEAMENSVGEQGIMSLVYGLHLLNNDCKSSHYTSEGLISEILSMQLEDGGWAVMGEYGDPDVTAMVIQALAPHSNSDEAVATAVDKALQLLSEKQLENGGFKSMGKESSESVFQVIIALSALETDAIADSRFVKNGNSLFSAAESFQLDNGSFCHEIGGEENYTSTVQAFMAATAYKKMKQGGGSLYIFDRSVAEESTAVETEATEATTCEVPEQTLEQEKTASYKPIACVVICIVAALTCIVLFAVGKRSVKNFIAVGVTALLLLVFVLLNNFSSAGDYYGNSDVKENTTGTVTLEIRCDTVAGSRDYIPENGVILAETEYAISDGDTVYDILVEACRENEIQMENSGGEMVYIAGIGYIYELAFGDLSGWLYFVNGTEASVGCGSYELADGDRVKFAYTCEMGNDLR